MKEALPDEFIQRDGRLGMGTKLTSLVRLSERNKAAGISGLSARGEEIIKDLN